MKFHSLKNAQYTATFKSIGAELCSFTDLRTGMEYIWQADQRLWARHSPLLFPIVGKLNEDKYKINNRIYKLPQHGFARDKEFTCIEQDDQRLVFRLESDESTLEVYPFNFCLDVIYTLHGNRLNTTFKVYNTSSEVMPFSIGGHPAFNCPFVHAADFEEYIITFQRPENVNRQLLNNGLLNENEEKFLDNEQTFPLKREYFQKDAIILKNLKSDWVRLMHRSGLQYIELNFKEFPYLGIWTKPNANFLCLEPWQGLADHEDFNGELTEKEGIIQLKPDKVYQVAYEITFN